MEVLLNTDEVLDLIDLNSNTTEQLCTQGDETPIWEAIKEYSVKQEGLLDITHLLVPNDKGKEVANRRNVMTAVLSHRVDTHLRTDGKEMQTPVLSNLKRSSVHGYIEGWNSTVLELKITIIRGDGYELEQNALAENTNTIVSNGKYQFPLKFKQNISTVKLKTLFRIKISPTDPFLAMNEPALTAVSDPIKIISKLRCTKSSDNTAKQLTTPSPKGEVKKRKQRDNDEEPVSAKLARIFDMVNEMGETLACVKHTHTCLQKELAILKKDLIRETYISETDTQTLEDDNGNMLKATTMTTLFESALLDLSNDGIWSDLCCRLE